MNKILLDTNILIYTIDNDSKFHNECKALFNRPDLRLYTTSKNLSEFLAVLTRTQELEISIKDAIQVLASLKSNLKILYPNSASY